jgi:hypothetical protein
MNIVGQKLKFIGCTPEQIQWGNCTDPAMLLNIGDVYTISKIEVHSWHTRLSFDGIEGEFNSTCFALI